MINNFEPKSPDLEIGFESSKGLSVLVQDSKCKRVYRQSVKREFPLSTLDQYFHLDHTIHA